MERETATQGLAQPTESGPASSAQPLSSTVLLAGQTERTIVHGDQIYRLRLTRNGKLILTK